MKEAKQNGFIVTTPDGWDIQPGLKDLPRFLTLELVARRNVGLEASNRHRKTSMRSCLRLERKRPRTKADNERNHFQRLSKADGKT
jgi:hypothetical protein